MKKTSFAKKLLAVFLSLLMAVGVATPAFAMEELNILDDVDADAADYALNPIADLRAAGNHNVDFDFKIGVLHGYFKAVQADANAPETFAQTASRYFGYTMTGISYVSSVIGLVNSVVSLLQMFGVIKSETEVLGEKIQYISESLQNVQLTVDEIDRKTDAILNTLTNEFADIDLKLIQQDYNHYKDNVWGRFYTDAMLPMQTLQTQYGDDINWLLVSYAEQWQNGSSKTDLRSLFGRNEEGELIQVYSGKNIGDIGKALPETPAKSIDSIAVDYSVTLPSEYISRNINKNVTLNSKNCLDTLAQAVKKGVYEAAEKGDFSAYGGFDAQWCSLTEEEKQQKAEEYAAYLTDALVFACSYTEANDKNYASDVKNAYQTFTKWLSGSDSLTSPLVAQFKMLSLTHSFEYEVIDQANDVGYSLCEMNMSYYSFVQTVLSMSKAYGEKANKEVSDMFENAEKAMTADYLGFVTGNPNYCYMTESVLEYKPIALESTASFVYDEPDNPDEIGKGVYYDGGFSTTDWQVYEKDKNSLSTLSQSKLFENSISTKEARLIYAMYKSNGGNGSFGDYLARNKVITDADDVAEDIITSFNISGIDLNKATSMICHWAAGVGEYDGDSYANGKTYSVPFDVRGRLDKNECYHVRDKVTGGMFNTATGETDDNGLIAARAFYGDKYKIYAFSTTDYSFTRNRTSDARIKELELFKDYCTYYDACGTFSTDDFGMLVSAEPKTYTFPASTKSVPDYYFGLGAEIEKLVFDGTPDSIADNAFAGVGTPANRCLIKAPFATGSLVNAWHGGYFGNTNITIVKNDGSGEKESAVVVAGAPVSSVVCTFTAPEHAAFDGWSFYPNGAAADSDEFIKVGTTLYAKWKYDHEHDFEVTADGKPATCTEDGCTEEKTCKTCGYKEVQVIPATGHSCTYFKTIDGEYIAECTHHDYYAHLYPETFGYHTVWSEDKSGSNVEYTGGGAGNISAAVTRITGNGVYVIESNDPGNKYDNQRVLIEDGVNADICLAGVDITGNSGYTGFNIGKSNVHLTLKDENKITAYQSNALSCAGNLTIDGEGSLTVNGGTGFAPMACTGEKTVIADGNIKVMGGTSCSVEINDKETGGKLVITENASVFAENGIDAVPVNENGERVYLVTISNSNFDTITVDGEALPHWVTDKDGNAYIYLTAGEHAIKVGEESFGFDPVNESDYLEKQYGDFTVLNSDMDPGAVSYEGGVLTVKKATPITVKNTDPSTPTTDRIVIAKNINADITLDGVSIQTEFLSGKYAITPIMIENDSTAKVRITLAAGSENVLVAGNNNAAICKNGEVGTLIIDGSGSLSATGGENAAAIGSSASNPVSGITINGGNIEAQTSGEGAAAIGAGRNDASAFEDGHNIARNIVINGGNVKAVSSDSTAIGAGHIGTPGNKSTLVKDIIINGGTVIAEGGADNYTIGGVNAENIRINGGVVTADSTEEGNGGIGGCSVVIENTASVKADIVESPVNGMGKSVSLNVIPIEIGNQICIDGKGYRCIGHNGENVMYLYLTNPDEIKELPGITLEKSERGKVYCSPSIPLPGDTVTLSASANEGYSFVDYEISPEVEIKDDTFTMPDEAVTVKGVFAKISTVTLTESEHGKVLPSKSIVTAGEKVSLYVMPDEGYELDTLTLTPETALKNGSFIMPEDDVTISCTFKPKTNTVTWNVDGETTEEKIPFGGEIKAPVVEEKEGYSFKGWTPEIPETMPDADMEFIAVFEPVVYTAKFKADGKVIASVDYTVNMGELDEPAVPQKDGYTGKWKEYTLSAGGITVEAQYIPDIYTARFVADGEIIKEVEYTVETLEITEPAVPEKTGYTGRWSSYDLRIGGVTVKAVYTAGEVHQHSFETKYSHNEAAHWFASTCGHDVAASLAPHTFGDGIVSDDTVKYICSECGYIKTVTDTEAGKARELELSINAAKDAVDKAAMGGDGEVNEYAETAKAELETKTDISAVNEKLAAVLEEINGMKTEKAVAEALAYLDTIADGSSSNKAKAAARQAKTAVKKAQTPEEVNAILGDALGEIEAAEQELADLCPDCGKAHEDNLWGRIACFFVRIFSWFKDFISKVFR